METPSLFQRYKSWDSFLPKCWMKLLQIMTCEEALSKSFSHFSASRVDSLEGPSRVICGFLLLGEKSVICVADGRSRKTKSHFSENLLIQDSGPQPRLGHREHFHRPVRTRPKLAFYLFKLTISEKLNFIQIKMPLQDIKFRNGSFLPKETF